MCSAAPLGDVARIQRLPQAGATAATVATVIYISPSVQLISGGGAAVYVFTLECRSRSVFRLMYALAAPAASPFPAPAPTPAL